VLGAFGRMLGKMPQYVLLLSAGSGLLAVLPRRGRRPLTPDGRAALALICVSVTTLLVAWVASQLSPAWTLRYLAVALPPLLLLCTLGLARAGSLGLVGLAVVAAMWVTDRPPDDKSNVRDVAEAIGPGLRPGDTVVSTQPEQIPVLAYYLPEGLRYATLWGPVEDVGITDWRDGVERIRRTSAARDLRPLLDAVEPGRRLVLVEPIVYEPERWSAPWTELVRIRSLQWEQHVGNDPRFQRVAVVPGSDEPQRSNPVRATVLMRRGMR
jgi:hypothetical protein